MQERIRPTREDVAKEAGVTKTIVSYVVNNNRYVDNKKRERVQAAIKKLGYRPNSIARALKGKTTNHILFVVDDIQSEHFSSIIKEIDSLVYKKGYFFTLCQDRVEDDFITRLTECIFDGIIIASKNFSKDSIQLLINMRIPIVFFEMQDYGELKGSYAKINTGLYDGAQNSVRILQEKGRKNIFYMGSTKEEGFRYKGFESQILASGLPLNKTIIIKEDIVGVSKTEDLKNTLTTIMKQDNPPDAFICRTDSEAFMAMKILQENGYKIPQDVSIIGFNNSSWCSNSNPTLSSVSIDRKEAARYVIEFLDTLIHSNDDKNYTVTLKTELIERDSI